MPGFIKGLTAADIPGANNFMPMDTSEPVSETNSCHASLPDLPSPLLSCPPCPCGQVLVSDFCEYAGQAVALVVAGMSTSGDYCLISTQTTICVHV